MKRCILLVARGGIEPPTRGFSEQFYYIAQSTTLYQIKQNTLKIHTFTLSFSFEFVYPCLWKSIAFALQLHSRKIRKANCQKMDGHDLLKNSLQNRACNGLKNTLKLHYEY